LDVADLTAAIERMLSLGFAGIDWEKLLMEEESKLETDQRNEGWKHHCEVPIKVT
jgi:hypothetical protein